MVDSRSDPLHTAEAIVRSFNILVLDEFIYGTDVYTRPEFNDKLGSVDKLAQFVVVDQVTAATPGTISVQLFHSADGINFVAKNASPEIDGEVIDEGATYKYYGSDSGTAPSLGFVQLKITSTVATQFHVKLWVTGRDDS